MKLKISCQLTLFCKNVNFLASIDLNEIERLMCSSACDSRGVYENEGNRWQCKPSRARKYGRPYYQPKEGIVAITLEKLSGSVER